MDVLDRIATYGTGLSPGQVNDWEWFKRAWDARMVAEHDHEWGGKFAAQLMHVVEEMAKEGGTNAFSRFVYLETRRCFSSEVALRLPSVG